jgi:hypothetical protein
MLVPTSTARVVTGAGRLPPINRSSSEDRHAGPGAERATILDPRRFAPAKDGESSRRDFVVRSNHVVWIKPGLDLAQPPVSMLTP